MVMNGNEIIQISSSSPGVTDNTSSNTFWAVSPITPSRKLKVHDDHEATSLSPGLADLKQRLDTYRKPPAQTDTKLNKVQHKQTNKASDQTNKTSD
ncbi:hypothetical protein LTR56_007852 [Elasticomyces elasticus]|nr:hypothetical protein LTR56_007852 [Elasticomyces elasticus]KAK3667901.1 hypothetical protein LTR22_001346 [Elasticomyces elasticus]KAK5747934.1 hypothetical protein LTS12_022035 [Elasticomyces elasticus]